MGSHRPAEYDEQVDRRAAELLAQAWERMRTAGLIDEKGEWVKKALPPDMREDSECDL